MNRFRAALAASLFPHLVHAVWTFVYAGRWTDHTASPEPFGAYPGALAFLGFTVLLLLLLGVVAQAVARRAALLAAALPVVAFGAYHGMAFGWLHWRAPGAAPIPDDHGRLWLLVVSVLLALLLGAMALSRRLREG
jgi:hypothetical protein